MLLSQEHSSVNVRDDLVRAHEAAMQRIGRAGTWFDGNTRVAIAAEVRHAHECALCKSRQSSLSPYAVTGQHDGLNGLPERIVEQVHRIATDPGRLTRNWLQSVLASGTSDAEYVEIVAVAATVISIDSFCRGVEMPLLPLPEPVAGEPTRRRPATARQEGEAWLPMIHPKDLEGKLETDEERVLARYWNGARNKPPRALSLVPQEAYAWFQLVEAQYLPLRAIRTRFDRLQERRAITHAQMELIASRASIVNKCAFCAPIHLRFLRESGGAESEAYDTNEATAAPAGRKIPHSALLVAFTDAVVGENDRELPRLRAEVRSKMGDAALVDAAAVAAAFNGINRVANSIGLRRAQPGMGGPGGRGGPGGPGGPGGGGMRRPGRLFEAF